MAQSSQLASSGDSIKSKASKITKIMHVGIGEDTNHYAIAPPLYMSSTYSFEALGKPRACDYGRTHNPNRSLLAQAIDILEGGAGTTITNSGMAAVHLPVQAFMNHGDLIIAPTGSYGSTIRLFNSLKDKGMIDVRWLDFSDLEQVEETIKTHRPKIVFMETASNPLLRVYDMPAIAALCQKYEALLVVDNTFLPGVVFPLEIGADIVIHSATKYLNGHGDIIAGTATSKTKEHAEQIAFWANNAGTTCSAFDSFQILRGMRTLFERMEKHQSNADAIAKFLKKSKHVETVYYPGLKSSFGHGTLKSIGNGFGAMIAFDLKGDLPAVKALVENLNWFNLAVSLGGYESLICHPQTMTHSTVCPDILSEAGITDKSIRMSVGLEDADDLIADLETAMKAI